MRQVSRFQADHKENVVVLMVLESALQGTGISLATTPLSSSLGNVLNLASPREPPVNNTKMSLFRMHLPLEYRTPLPKRRLQQLTFLLGRFQVDGTVCF